MPLNTCVLEMNVQILDQEDSIVSFGTGSWQSHRWLRFLIRFQLNASNHSLTETSNIQALH
jgi:hypothetical protein